MQRFIPRGIHINLDWHGEEVKKQCLIHCLLAPLIGRLLDQCVNASTVYTIPLLLTLCERLASLPGGQWPPLTRRCNLRQVNSSQKARHDQSRERICLANEGRRKKGASAAWPTPLGINPAHPKIDIANTWQTHQNLSRPRKVWSNDHDQPSASEERVGRKNIPCRALMRRIAASDVVTGVPFHSRSWSEMNQMKRDDMSLDRLSKDRVV